MRNPNRKFLVFLLMVTLTAAVGQIFTYLTHGPDNSEGYLHALFAWTLGGAMGWAFEFYLVPSPLGAPIRRMGFVTVILLNGVTITSIVVFVTIIENLLFHGGLELKFFTSPIFYMVLLVVFITFTGLNSILQIIRIIGGRVLVNFILGRYHHPVQEDRIFMFLDIKGSTALAQKLGDVGMQRLISRFFFDIAEPIAQYGGEVHRYIGDQVVVTWPLSNSNMILQALRCYFTIRKLTTRLNPRYLKQFGAEIDYRVGMHGGPVVASECGDRKQEIVYFGDTINTAARIEQYCKDANSPFLISAQLLNRIELPMDWQKEVKAVTRLRGHDHETELMVVTQSEGSTA